VDAVGLHHSPDDQARLQAMREVGRAHALPLVAAGDVHMHVRARRRLQDTMTAIRRRTPVAEAGGLAVSQWRAPPAHATGVGGDLSRRPAGRNGAHRRALPFDMKQIRYLLSA
jgi:hypothetical protein